MGPGYPAAIFFDLDDTLFDCQSQLVLPAHREAIAAMIAAGLPAAPEEALRRRLDLFRERPRDDVNHLLAASYGTSAPQVAAAGYRAFHRREIGPLRAEAGVSEMLQGLKELHSLYLISAGDPSTQAEKVRRLDLSHRFDEIVYVDPSRGETKAGAFRRLLERHGLDPGRCLTVGNRIDSEIRAGNALGMMTVWLRSGEYAHLEPSGPEERPDRTIGTISELPELIQSLGIGGR